MQDHSTSEPVDTYIQENIKEITIMKYLDYMTKASGTDLSTAEDAGYLLNGYLTEKGYALFDIASRKVYPKIIIDEAVKKVSALDKLFK